MARILYLPGLGADQRLFSELEQHLAGTCPKWPQPGDSNLAQYAEKCIEAWEVSAEDVLVGFSFGAQVALEIQHNFQQSGGNMPFVAMISGIGTSRELDPEFKNRVRMMAFCPDLLLRWLFVLLGPWHALRGSKINSSQRHMLSAMAKSMDLSFFRWAANACANWQFEPRRLKLLRINGRNDTVIPFEEDSVDWIVEHGAHLIVYTHAEAIAQRILAALGETNHG
ncbi:MAG: hypothetical protein AB8G05_17700 [Oligoflexales bacterium]